MSKAKLDLSAAKPSSLITFLLDRSGSMGDIKHATIEGFNAYIAGLKEEKESDIFFTFVQFDALGFGRTELMKVCVSVPIAKAPLLTFDNFLPRGGTPLIDAAYETILATVAAVEKRADNPKVVICIQTDGEENQSRDHTWEQLKNLIAAQQEKGWEFNFMGAGIDAYKQAAQMGISRGQTMSYGKDLFGTQSAFQASAVNAANFSSARTSNTAYSSVQKVAAGDLFDRAD